MKAYLREGLSTDGQKTSKLFEDSELKFQLNNLFPTNTAYTITQYVVQCSSLGQYYFFILF